ncbi:MAG: hypothetical protein IPN62_00515 [Flavobacteriales bacterium]|jgi:hypothetical protein|nr:hypothetical protein [Flavobacteriales bacterium]
MMHIRQLLFVSFLLPGAAGAQAPSPAKDVQVPSAVRDAYQGAWEVSTTQDAEKLEQIPDAALFSAPKANLDAFRQQRNDALIRGKGELTPADRDLLKQQFTALEAIDPQGFDTHLAGYHLLFPDQKAFGHLEAAVAQDADRPELIAPRLVSAVRSGDRVAFERWGKALKEKDHVAPGLWAAAKDLLLSVDQDGVLITAGEMDAYPTWGLQAASGERRDVLVVDERLLADPAYRQRVWTDARCVGPVPTSTEALIAALPGSSPRPVFLSMALGGRIDPSWEDELYVTGTAFRFSETPFDNIPVLEMRWVDLKKPMDAGPLSRNYLVPAVVLLKHFRAVGDEAGVARMERSVRALAQQLKVTNELYRTGILQH